jgi:hypothetical protein
VPAFRKDQMAHEQFRMQQLRALHERPL